MPRYTFAKLIELSDTQFLAWIERWSRSDETVIHQLFEAGGAIIDASLVFNGEDQEEKATAALGRIDAKHADGIVQAVRKLAEGSSD